MSVVVIPFIPSQADDKFATSIDGVSYVFDVHWNYRENIFYMGISDANQTPIISGVKIVLGAFLGRMAGVAPLDNGVLVAVDTSNAGIEAGFDDLGKRVIVQFMAVPDLIARIGIAAGK